MNNRKYLLTSASNHSGFSNKIHAWANAYYLAQQNDRILVQDWPGDSHLLTLPNTISANELDANLSWTEFDTNTLKDTERLPLDDYIKLTCGFNYNRSFFSKINHRSLFQQIQFNHESFSKILDITNDQNLVGVHMRRSDFYPPTETDIDFIRINTQVHEKWFVSVMKDLQKANPNIKFYLATEDITKFKHLYEQFNIIDRRAILAEEPERPLQNYVLCLSDFIDLFVLKHVNCFIETPRSSYSHLASLMRNKPTITSNTYKGYYFHTRNY
jgi:hypothetical protein